MNREQIIKEIEKYNEDIIFQEEGMSVSELAQTLEAYKYPKRREDGQMFSDMQGAKLVISDIPDVAKKEISKFFAKLQNFLVIGWWKSAQREANDMEPNQFVSQDLIDNVKAYIDNYVSNSYE